MIMNMIMTKIRQFGRIRHLHTIISQETIKPSSQTPHHLKTHNLPLLDQLSPNFQLPNVYFYKNYNRGDISFLKQSLSKCLTQYYPFAGRLWLSPTSSYIDCNDEGIEFIEASNDSLLDDFILNKNQDEKFDQLIPKIGLDLNVSKTSSSNLLEVQVNHFAGGGVAITVSMSHKIADGFTAGSFTDHWATVTRGQSPMGPRFFSSSTSNDIIKVPMGTLAMPIKKNNYISRRFVFSTSKLNELKKKVIAMGTTPINPTRVELLTSLLFKCVVRAATTKSGYLKPSSLLHTVNMRNKIIKNCTEIAVGNIMTVVTAKMAGLGEIKLNEVIVELRKVKMEVEGLKDMQEVGKHYLNTILMLRGDQSQSYVVSSSLCRLPFYNVDFGWGKPIQVMTRITNMPGNGFILSDTPSGDGIEALMHLEKEEMSILEKDVELLTYVEDE